MRMNFARAFAVLVLAAAPAVGQSSDIWVCGYYPGWAQPAMPPASIDYTGLTHVIHFSMLPGTGGRMYPQFITHAQSVAAVTAAHNANKKILLCLGGASTRDSFVVATRPQSVAACVKNIVDSVRALNYDGVDIDWEPVENADSAQFGALTRGLRASLDSMNPPRLLTTAVACEPAVLNLYARYFDQMNLMTYGMSNAWPGWVTWHESPLYDGGFRFPSTNGLVPSIDGSVNQYTGAGIPAAKLGFGMGFYGTLWSGGAGTPAGGATAPRQSYTTDPTVQDEIPYTDIVNTYYSAANNHWDTAAAAAYLGDDHAGSATDTFLSYENETTAAVKVAYARSKHVGGFIIWHIGHGYFGNLPSGQRNPLLAAISRSLHGVRTDAGLLAAAQKADAALRICLMNGAVPTVAGSGEWYDLRGRAVGDGAMIGHARMANGILLRKQVSGR